MFSAKHLYLINPAKSLFYAVNDLFAELECLALNIFLRVFRVLIGFTGLLAYKAIGSV